MTLASHGHGEGTSCPSREGYQGIEEGWACEVTSTVRVTETGKVSRLSFIRSHALTRSPDRPKPKCCPFILEAGFALGLGKTLWKCFASSVRTARLHTRLHPEEEKMLLKWILAEEDQLLGDRSDTANGDNAERNA